MSGVVPKRILDRHIISSRQILEMNLRLEEKFQVLSVASSGVCALFFISLYGARGNFYDEKEKALFYATIVLGAALLFGTALWKGFVIRKEMRKEEETGEQIATKPPDKTYLAKVSRFWVALAFAVTSTHTLVSARATWVVYGDVSLMESKEYIILSTVAMSTLPMVIVVYVVSLFADPAAKSLTFLRFHFFCFCGLGEVCMVVKDLSTGLVGNALLHLGFSICQILTFHFAVNVRASVGRLPPKELHDFLITKLFGQGGRVISGILFISFRR